MMDTDAPSIRQALKLDNEAIYAARMATLVGVATSLYTQMVLKDGNVHWAREDDVHGELEVLMDRSLVAASVLVDSLYTSSEWDVEDG